MKYLYPYECEKQKLSTPQELQAAIDGNRREGRRSSYPSYAELTGGRPPGFTTLPSSFNNPMSPLSLTTSHAQNAMRHAINSNGIGSHQHLLGIPPPPPPGRELSYYPYTLNFS